MKKWLTILTLLVSAPAMAYTILLEGHDNIPDVWEFGSSSLTFPGKSFQYKTNLKKKNEAAVIILNKDETHPHEQVITFYYENNKTIKMTVGDVVTRLNLQSSDIIKVEGPKPPGYTYYVRIMKDADYARFIKEK